MPANPSNPDQKDLPPWRKRLQGWRQKWLYFCRRNWRIWAEDRISRINNKIWVWDRTSINFQKKSFDYLGVFFPWLKKLPRNRPVSTCLFMIPLILVFIFQFQELLIACQELFIFIFPFSAIAIKPFLLSVWDAILILIFVTISGLIFFWLIPQSFGWLAKIISSVWFLLLLFLGFALALYHPPLADSVLSIVTEEKTGKIIPFVPAIATILGLLLFAQRLDVMNEQIETTQDQHEVDLFKQACELLGHEKTVTRMGGITLLGVLTQTDPETWHVAVVDALANFIRVQSADDKDSPVEGFLKFLATKEKDEKEAEAKWKKLDELKTNKAPADIEAAIRVIACDLTKEQKTIIQKHLKKVRRWPDLRESWLCRIKLNGAYLPKANLKDSFLSYTHLIKSDLTGAEFSQSHLDRTLFSATALQDAMFLWTNLTDANLRTATGLENNIEGPENSGVLDGYYIKNEEPPILPDGIIKPISINIADYWPMTRSLRAIDLSTAWKIFDKMFGGRKK